MVSHAMLFSGSSNRPLAQEIASLLGISLGKMDLHFFPDKEIYVEILDHVEQRDIFVLQTLALDPNVYLMELLIILDALKRAGAASIRVVLPYYAYARQDRLDKPGTAITAKLIADMMTKAGADHIITVDLHSEQIEGFFDIPMEHLLTRTLLIPYCSSLNLENLVVVAPDKGGIKIASAYAKELEIPMALIDKERLDPFRVKMTMFVGNVKGCTVLLVDDMCSTAGTLLQAASACIELGATRVLSVVGHGLFIGNALESIAKSPIEMVITTNSVPISENVRLQPKIRVVSIAPLLADAMSFCSMNDK